jgi:formylglycine-generating enzyme required for sulfatase activity
MMGDPPEEKGPYNERGKPRHKVTVTKGFHLGRYEVTVAQFKRFADSTGYRTEAEKEGWGHSWERGAWKKVNGISWRKPPFPQTERHPVVLVSWNDAVAFCAWASKQAGKKVRLPTEAEWEYACRAGTTTEFCSGDGVEALKQVGWCSYDGKRGSAKTTKRVGQFKPNAWGLFDVHGNVWEWCQDRHGRYAPEAVTDPMGPSTGDRRVRRGGSWNSLPDRCRSAHRSSNIPSNRTTHRGLRTALDF